MRNFGLDVRAGGPRRSQASSLRSSCWRRSSRAASCRVALGAREHVGRVAALVLVHARRRRPPRCAVQTASRNQRSWVTTSIEPRRAARCRASQSTPSTSRWLVGSSSSSSSGASSSSRASAIRRRSPPRERRDRRVQPCGKRAQRDAAEQPVEHVAERGVGRPLVVGAAADQLLADRAAPGRARRPGRAAPRRTPPARVTAPASGSSRPAISRSSVDLPSPLRPTTPMRSPAATPSVTSSSTERLP